MDSTAIVTASSGENLGSIFVPIIMFAMIFGIVYVTASARHRERMAMIDKGVDPKLFTQKKVRNHDNNLKWGIIVVLVAVGLIVGNVVSKAAMIDEDVAGPTFPLLFGGLGLLIFYFIRKAKYEGQDGPGDQQSK